MNKIMLSLFAILAAAFAYAHVMREQVKAEASAYAVEVAR